MAATLHEALSEKTSAGQLDQRARLGDVIDLNWLETRPLELRDVELQLRELAGKVVADAAVRFSAHEEPRYRSVPLGTANAPGRVRQSGRNGWRVAGLAGDGQENQRHPRPHVPRGVGFRSERRPGGVPAFSIVLARFPERRGLSQLMPCRHVHTLARSVSSPAVQAVGDTITESVVFTNCEVAPSGTLTLPSTGGNGPCFSWDLRRVQRCARGHVTVPHQEERSVSPLRNAQPAP